MDNSGLFAEIFKDYKKPPKDVIGKLSDAYASYQDFVAPKNELERNIQGMIEQWNPAGVGMVAGPAVVKELYKRSPTYASKVTEGLREIIEQGKGKGLFQQASSNKPGLFKGDVYTQPATRELYESTRTLPMPYTVINPLTDKPTLQYGLDLGRAYVKPGILDQVSDLLSRGEKVRMSDVVELPRRGLMDAVYGKDWLANVTLGLKDKGIRNPSTLGAASATYDPFKKYWGRVDIENIDTLDPKNMGLLGGVLNHELNHLTMALGGLPSGSSAKAFNPLVGDKYARAPIGMEKVGAGKLYQSDLGEIFARASEPEKGNLLQNLINATPLDNLGLFGTRLPTVVRERLKHPIPGQDYQFGGEHLGWDAKDWIERLGFKWDDMQRWRNKP
jgi:hypothetical protein